MFGLFNKSTELKGFSRSALELNFNLPPYRLKDNRPTDTVEIFQKFEALAAEPVHLLVEINLYLRKINCTYIDIAKRFVITERCIRFAKPAIRSIFSEYYKGKALPETPARREALSAAIISAQGLSISFKRVFKSDYNLPDREFKHVRRRSRLCAFYILNMILVEQRLNSLRYMSLSSNAWRECNNVFFALLGTDNVNREQKSLDCLKLSRPGIGHINDKSEKTTPHAIYIVVQLMGFFDPNTLSLHQIAIVEIYVNLFAAEFATLACDAEPAINNLYIFSDQDTPPRLDNKNGAGEFLRCINVKSLEKSLKAEHAKLKVLLLGEGSDFESENPPVANVSSAEDIERFLAISHMLKKFQAVQRSDTRRYSDVQLDLHVYNGFTPSFRMLSSIESNPSDAGNFTNQLRESLAQRSAIMSESGANGDMTRWSIVNESSGGILIQTKATQYLKNLFVGQLIAFAGTQHSIKQPSLGYVTRIRRIEETLIEVSIKCISNQVECAAIQNDMLHKNNMALPAILIIDAGEYLQILIHQSHRLLPGTEIKLQRNNELFTHRLGPIQEVRREFVVYNVNSL